MNFYYTPKSVEIMFKMSNKMHTMFDDEDFVFQYVKSNPMMLKSRESLVERVNAFVDEYCNKNFIEPPKKLINASEKEVRWPVFWALIHSLADSGKDYSCFFKEQLRRLLPCIDCSNHYIDEFEKHYTPWPERANNMHNEINISLWKPIYDSN